MTTSERGTATTTGVNRQAGVRIVYVLCWAAALFDGYDLLVFGTIAPVLLRDKTWHVTPAEVGVIGSAGLLGMLIGALLVGTLTDMVGPRRMIPACLVWFSLAMVGAAFAASPAMLGTFRFVAGIGLGGILPTITALTLEYAKPHRRQFTFAAMFSGASMGGLFAAALAIPLIPAFGWRAPLLVGAVPIVLAPICLRYLPESMAFLRSRGRHAEANRIATRFGLPTQEPQAGGDVAQDRLASVRMLFTRSRLLTTLLLWTATFVGLLLLYGLASWLPEIMRRSGYELGSALLFAVALNAGAVIGTLWGGWLADRIGLRTVVMTAFGAAAVATVVLSFQLPLGINLLVVAVAGFGSQGTTILMNAFVASAYPATARATAVGWSLGVGRLGAVLGPLIGGALISSQLPLAFSFYVFAAAAVLGGIAALLTRIRA